MAAAEASHVPESKKRKQDTQEAAKSGFWDAGFARRGTVVARNSDDVCPLCSGCRSLLIRPACDANAQQGVSSLTDPRWVVRRSVSEVSSAAMNGCTTCNLVIAAQATILQHITAVDQLHSFRLALYWSDDAGVFNGIEVIPVDHMNRNISLHGRLNGIGLTVEDAHEDKAIDYPSPQHTNTELCRSLATRWLIDCMTSHAECREQKISANWLPTRLIDVRLNGDSQQPRLLITSEFNSASRNSYVTLSHRWASTNVLKLVSSNIDSFRQCIPLELLSSTFLDAIRVTQALGLRYLWIDSLCIIQDSLTDWEAESAGMASIYRNGVLNIAATGSSDNGGGLFQERNTHWVTPSKVRIQYKGHDKVYSASLDGLWGKYINRATLNRRAWVLQERLLSPRTLHFAPQLFWECRRLQACETYPEGMPSHDYFCEELDGSESPISLKNWYKEFEGQFEGQFEGKFEGKEFWVDVIRSYGRCSITMASDRLVAIAGLAQSLQPLLRDEYLAGLWKTDLPYNLVWSMWNTEGEVQLPDNNICPSWSWAALVYTSAAIEDLLISADCRVKTLVSVRDVYAKPLESGPSSALRSYLQLMGNVGRVFSLASTDRREGEWIHGHFSFETHIDLGSSSIDDESLYCLPLLVRKQNPGPEGWPTITDCLLLKRLKPGTSEYTRVGLLKVSLDLEDTLPPEIRWIAEYARSERCSEDLSRLTIY